VTAAPEPGAPRGERWASAIYRGRIRHRRFRPHRHDFSYPLFMTYLDLDELPRLFDRRWLWSVGRPNLACFLRRDYFGDPSLPLDEAVRRRVASASGVRPEGPIRLLTHLRTFGFAMNPVSFYYCFDAAGRRPEQLLVEVTNTPWGERHGYVLADPEERRGGVAVYRRPKALHVSPFMAMDFTYRFHLTDPGERLRVHVENLEGSGDGAEGGKLFDATLDLQRRPITGATLAGALLRYPFMTLRVAVWIYLQAGRLWLEKTPFHPHPARRDGDEGRPTTKAKGGAP